MSVRTPASHALALYEIGYDGTGFVTTTSLTGQPFDPVLYSDVKYGSHSAAAQFGRALGDALVHSWPFLALANPPPMVVANPHFHIPHAAHLLTNAVEARLNSVRQSLGLLSLSRAEIRRRSNGLGANEKSYGRLPASERSAWAAANPILLADGSDVAGRDLLVFDDLLVTGTAMDQMGRFLREAGANHISFAFVGAIDLAGGTWSAEVEASLNQSNISTLEDLARLRESGGWTMTPWACRLILTDPDPARLRRFIGSLSTDELGALREAVIVERYDQQATYRTNAGLVLAAVSPAIHPSDRPGSNQPPARQRGAADSGDVTL